MHSLTIISRDARRYRELIEQLDIADLATYAYETPQAAEKASFESDILLADPGLIADILDRFESLKWMQSTWAGNAPLLQADKRDYALTGVKGVFGDYMREFVFAYMLHFSRNIQGFAQNQTKQCWQAPSFTQLKGKTLGLLGVGSIGEAIAQTAKHFDMRVVGSTRSSNTCQYVDHYYCSKEKYLLAKEADYLVSILPDTPDTQRFVDTSFLEYVKPESILINVGRGSTIDEKALIHALKANKLKAAVLDVFEQEPLVKGHPFWTLDNVIVTNHTAAVSYPDDIFQLFYDNYQRFTNGKPLVHELDFELGY